MLLLQISNYVSARKFLVTLDCADRADRADILIIMRILLSSR